jgi:hypothetical protein
LKLSLIQEQPEWEHQTSGVELTSGDLKQFGRVSIPQDAFLNYFKSGE